jgi:hypothetical protein
MLRTYFLQHWFNLSGPEMGDAFYESVAVQKVKPYCGLKRGWRPAAGFCSGLGRKGGSLNRRNLLSFSIIG